MELKHIDKNLITEFKLYLINNTKANDVTRATYIGNLRTILNYFMAEGYIKKFIVEIPKYDVPIQEIHIDEELIKLWEKPKMTKRHFKFTEYRN